MLSFKFYLFVLYLQLYKSNGFEHCGEWRAYNDKCIKLFADSKSYNVAQNICAQNENSTLLTIHSKEENEFILQNVRNNVWIGAQYHNNELKWNDKSPVNYTNLDYPIGGLLNCVQLSYSFPKFGKWIVGSCDNKNMVVCQRNRINWYQKHMNEMRTVLLTTQNKLNRNIIELNETKKDLYDTKSSFQKQFIELKMSLESNRREFNRTNTRLENELNITKISQNANNESLLNLRTKTENSSQKLESTIFNLSSKLDDFKHKNNAKQGLCENELIRNKRELLEIKNNLLNLENRVDISNQIIESTKINLNTTLNEFEDGFIQHLVYTNKSVEIALNSTINELMSAKTLLTNSVNELNNDLKDTKREFKDEINIKTKNLENTRKQITTVIETKLSALKKEIEKSIPVATIAYFATDKAPNGWLKANGQSVSRTSYSKLYSIIGTTFGSGDGSTTFSLPNLSGKFTRSWSDSSFDDVENNFRRLQTSSSFQRRFKSIKATNQDNFGFSGKNLDSNFETDLISDETSDGSEFPNDRVEHHVSYFNKTEIGPISHSITQVFKGTRPRNIELLACIKY